MSKTRTSATRGQRGISNDPACAKGFPKAGSGSSRQGCGSGWRRPKTGSDRREEKKTRSDCQEKKPGSDPRNTNQIRIQPIFDLIKINIKFFLSMCQSNNSYINALLQLLSVNTERKVFRSFTLISKTGSGSATLVAGMSIGCILDGTVLAYSSPALPSLIKESSTLHIDIRQASLLGEQNSTYISFI